MREILKNPPALLLATLLWFSIPGVTNAQSVESLDFDIFRAKDSLTVWIDFQPLLNAERVDQMKQGIDLAVQYELTLMKPRKLWGAQKTDNCSRAFKLGYRIVAENYFLSTELTPTDSDRYFITLSALAEFLTDSIQTALCSIDSLDESDKYYLDLRITTITLTALNLASEDTPAQGQDQSPIKYLFRKFLEVTDFGREEYQFKSRLFSLDEIGQK